jgi:DNA polymerase
MSPAQMNDITGLPDCTSETMALMLREGAAVHGEGVVLLCEARAAVASIARGKLVAGLERVSPDGRLRDMHRYYGAHTGRWSGSGMQLQNLPRPADRFEDWTDADICRRADEVLAGGHCDAEEVDLLLRACLTGPLAVCDFSGVEARMNAWCAGDAGALEVFRGGKIKPYFLMASTIFGEDYDALVAGGKGVKYQIGKQAELACQYSMGARKFDATARKAGVSLEAIGVAPAEVVAAWREQHRAIVEFWWALERAFVAAVRDGDATDIPVPSGAAFAFRPATDGSGDVAIFLPSGRPIVYPKCGLSFDHKRRPQLSYESSFDARPVNPETGEREGEAEPMRAHLYGGLICENVIQGACRDLLADALVRTEREGMAPVLHVHDEIAVQGRGKEAYDNLHRIMMTLPDWARGFPVGAAGFSGERYRK